MCVFLKCNRLHAVSECMHEQTNKQMCVHCTYVQADDMRQITFQFEKHMKEMVARKTGRIATRMIPGEEFVHVIKRTLNAQCHSPCNASQ